MTKLRAQLLGLSLTVLLSAGCAVGPNYKRPRVDVPGTYRGALPPQATQPATESFGDQKWWDVFQDKQLQDLIHVALQQNYDVRIAATRILQAQAQLGITRADQWPTISGAAQAVNERNPKTKLFRQYETSANQVDLSLAWELDFWGKYRRATESARATLFANPASFARPAARNFAGYVGFAPGLLAAHANIGKRWGHIHARRPAGRAVGGHCG